MTVSAMARSGLEAAEEADVLDVCIDGLCSESGGGVLS